MTKAKHKHYFLDIYKVNIHVAVTRAELKHMLKIFKKMDNPLDRDHPPAACTAGFIGITNNVKSYHVIFWMDKKAWKRAGKNYEVLANTTSHEATHGAGMIWNHIGAEMSNDTLRGDEPMAYLIGWLTEFLFDAVTS